MRFLPSGYGGDGQWRKVAGAKCMVTRLENWYRASYRGTSLKNGSNSIPVGSSALEID